MRVHRHLVRRHPFHSEFTEELAGVVGVSDQLGSVTSRGEMICCNNPNGLGAFCFGVLSETVLRECTLHEWDGGAQSIIGAHRQRNSRTALRERIIITLAVKEVQVSFEKGKAPGTARVAESHEPEPDGDNWLATLKDSDGNVIQLSTPWRG